MVSDACRSCPARRGAPKSSGSNCCRNRRAPRATAEHAAQDVLEAAAARAAAAAALERRKPSGPKLKLSKARRLPDRNRRRPAARRSLEALEARLALGVDLAAVERLALVVVADDLVGGVELGKARRPPSGSCLLASGCSFLASLR